MVKRLKLIKIDFSSINKNKIEYQISVGQFPQIFSTIQTWVLNNGDYPCLMSLNESAGRLLFLKSAPWSTQTPENFTYYSYTKSESKERQGLFSLPQFHPRVR